METTSFESSQRVGAPVDQTLTERWPAPGDPLEAFLRRWRLIVALALLGFSVAGGVVLLLPARQVGRARLYLEQIGVGTFDRDERGAPAQLLHAHVSLLSSKPVLSLFLESDGAASLPLKRYANPLDRLQQGFRVEVGRNLDAVTVSFESADADEVIQVVDGVIRAYLEYESARRTSAAASMLAVLQKELDARHQELQAKMAQRLVPSPEDKAWRQELGDLSARLAQAQFDRSVAQEVASIEPDVKSLLGLEAASQKERTMQQALDRHQRLLAQDNDPKKLALQSEIRRLERLCELLDIRAQDIRLVRSLDRPILTRLGETYLEPDSAWGRSLQIMTAGSLLGALAGGTIIALFQPSAARRESNR